MSESFTVYPAIDLNGGRVVRLEQGDLNRQKSYSDDPVHVGNQWISEGATWIHIVNLDGAFDAQTEENHRAVARLAESFSAKCHLQLGGGIRSIKQIESALAMGVHRVVLGTIAVEQPELVREAIAKFGDKCIAIGIDVKDGSVRTRGWEKNSAIRADKLVGSLVDMGAQTFIVTNIARDGLETGPDLEMPMSLQSEFNCECIASGGVASVNDVKDVKQRGLGGVIIGRALYEGNFNLNDALSV